MTQPRVWPSSATGQLSFPDSRSSRRAASAYLWSPDRPEDLFTSVAIPASINVVGRRGQANVLVLELCKKLKHWN